MVLYSKEQVRDMLPQRAPFLFVDEVLEAESGKRLVAKKYLDPNEEFFKGHFPGNPVMPGVLTVEAMAQAAILLYYVTKPAIAKTKPDYFLGKVESKFLAPVFPGDTLILEVEVVKILNFQGIVSVRARVGEKLVARAQLAFGIKQNPKKGQTPGGEK